MTISMTTYEFNSAHLKQRGVERRHGSPAAPGRQHAAREGGVLAVDGFGAAQLADQDGHQLGQVGRHVRLRGKG